MKRAELIALCKERGIRGYTGKSVAELRALVGATADTIAHVPAGTLLLGLHQGNALDHMRSLPDASVDMVCTDPPYFLDGLGDGWNKAALDKKGASAIVGNLPKGMRFDRDQSRKFHAFYQTVSAEVFRVLKPGGAFLSFSSPRLYHAMAWAIEEAGFEIRDMIGWIYTQSQVKAFSQDHIIENDKTRSADAKAALKAATAGWKTPQLKPAIEPICLAVKPNQGRFIDNFETYGTGLMNTVTTGVGTDGAFFPANVVTTEPLPTHAEMDRVFLVPKPTKAEKGDYNTHLSVKPVALIRHLIRLFTKPDAVVLDPFMGSGTTAVACIQEGRRWVGYDTNAEYIAIANKRIEEAAKDSVSPA